MDGARRFVSILLLFTVVSHATLASAEVFVEGDLARQAALGFVARSLCIPPPPRSWGGEVVAARA